jgi:hypothetical protein
MLSDRGGISKTFEFWCCRFIDIFFGLGRREFIAGVVGTGKLDDCQQSGGMTPS